MSIETRPELPADMPPGIARLPTHRGYPVPWFVAVIDGVPDFRVMREEAVKKAVTQDRCWICGQTLLIGLRAYVAGPMCGINRNSAEPPSHVNCADWAARACPFLVRPHAKRREKGLPEEGTVAPGAIMRNPGVAMVWVTKATQVRQVGRNLYFNLGQPSEVRWYAHGQPASREEVLDSVETGLPLLAQGCRDDADRAELQRLVTRFERWLPEAL